MVTVPDWSIGKCIDQDPDIFSEPEHEETAKAICALCVIKDDCLTWAIETKQADCVWGGMNADMRSAVNRPKKRVKCPSCSGTILRKNEHNKTQLCKSCGLTWKV